MLLTAIREGLGRLIVLIDFLTRPKPITRSSEAQSEVEDAVKNFSLYQFYACPFCIKTRRHIRRLNLPIEMRNAQKEGEHRQALQNEGGKIQVPCLRIDHADGQVEWMYESKAVIRYLTDRFDPQASSETAQ